MSPDEQSSLPDLLQAEKAGWEELEGLVEALTPKQAGISGYLPGWSVKDFLAHIAGWLAEAGAATTPSRVNPDANATAACCWRPEYLVM